MRQLWLIVGTWTRVTFRQRQPHCTFQYDMHKKRVYTSQLLRFQCCHKTPAAAMRLPRRLLAMASTLGIWGIRAWLSGSSLRGKSLLSTRILSRQLDKRRENVCPGRAINVHTRRVDAFCRQTVIPFRDFSTFREFLYLVL